MVNGTIRADNLTADVTARDSERQRPALDRASRERQDGERVDRASFGGASWNGEATFETVNGSVTVEVPEAANADIEIRTTNGRITTDLPIATTRSSRRRVEGTLGDGGPTLRLKTVNGSITLGPTSE